MKFAFPGVIGALTLTACTTMAPNDAPATAEPADTCQAEPGQRFVGQQASPEVAHQIMAATRSTRFRWVPPRTAVTMEYAFGRVTVSYDDDLRITTIACS